MWSLLAEEKEWAGLHLARESILSANEVHELFTKEDGNPLVARARLLVLCACVSGTQRKGDGAKCSLSGSPTAIIIIIILGWCGVCDLMTVFVYSLLVDRLRSWRYQERRCAGLCPSRTGWRHSVSAGVQVAHSRSGKHHFDESSVYHNGNTRGVAVGHMCTVCGVLWSVNGVFESLSV